MKQRGRQQPSRRAGKVSVQAKSGIKVLWLPGLRRILGTGNLVSPACATVSPPPNTVRAAQPRSQRGKPRETCSTPLKPSAPLDLAPSSSGDGEPRWAPLT